MNWNSRPGWRRFLKELTLFTFLRTSAKFGHELTVRLGLCRGAPLEERKIREAL